jgi:hypothetical protein
MAYQNLETFIEECISDTDRKCTMLTCLYELPTGGSKEVQSVPLGGKTWDSATLYRMFKGISESHVQDRPGLHTFILQPYFDGKNTPDRSRTFIVSDGEIKNGGAGRVVTEHPTNAGLIAQQMRHAEELVRANVGLVQTMAATWMTERRELLVHESTQRREINDAYQIVRELMMAAGEREHQRTMQQLEFERSSKERELMVKMAPTLLNAVSGKEVIPNEAGDSALIDMIAESVSPDQIQQLVTAGILKAEMAGPLTMRFAQAREKKLKEAAEKKRLPEGETTNVTSIVKAKERA